MPAKFFGEVEFWFAAIATAIVTFMVVAIRDPDRTPGQ